MCNTTIMVTLAELINYRKTSKLGDHNQQFGLDLCWIAALILFCQSEYIIWTWFPKTISPKHVAWTFWNYKYIEPIIIIISKYELVFALIIMDIQPLCCIHTSCFLCTYMMHNAVTLLCYHYVTKMIIAYISMNTHVLIMYIQWQMKKYVISFQYPLQLSKSTSACLLSH